VVGVTYLAHFLDARVNLGVWLRVLLASSLAALSPTLAIAFALALSS
jgi:hypothetical protein